MNEPAGTYQEWRVTGQPGNGYPPYEYVWSRRITPSLRDPEAAARAFASNCIPIPWADGPHLSRRTVTVEEWELLP